PEGYPHFVPRLALAFLAFLLALTGCGGHDGSAAHTPAEGSGGLSLSVSFSPERLRAGRPVTWSLRVTNTGTDTVTLTFRTGDDEGEGDDERPLEALDEEAGPSEDEGEHEE